MTLRETLQQLKTKSRSRVPAEAAAIMAQATQQIEESGIAKNALNAGQKAPAFELPDCYGKTYRSAALLAAGPLVIHFYRGTW